MSLHPTLTKLDHRVLAIVGGMSPRALRATDVARILRGRERRAGIRRCTTASEVRSILRGLAHFGHVRETRNGWYRLKREPLR